MEFSDPVVVVGQRTVFTCTVASTSQPTANLHVPNGTTYRYYPHYNYSGLHSFTYTIYSVGLEDVGEYCCSNDGNSLCTTLYILGVGVGECCNMPPHISSNSSTLLFACYIQIFSGLLRIPVATVQWSLIVDVCCLSALYHCVDIIMSLHCANIFM